MLCTRTDIMATTVGDLIEQHHVNPIQNTGLQTGSHKPWTTAYPPITKINVRTRLKTVHVDRAPARTAGSRLRALLRKAKGCTADKLNRAESGRGLSVLMVGIADHTVLD